MGLRVLVLISSGRANSNSSAMAHAFAEAARQAGHQTSIVDVFAMKIGPCNGCGSCFTAGRPCIFDDDFTQLGAQVREADVVVFAAPVYWYTFPMKMKAAIDKLVSFLWGGVDVAGKRCVLLACATEDDADYVFEGIRVAYECTAAHLGWESAGKVLQAGVRNPGDIAHTDALERCAQLAAAL